MSKESNIKILIACHKPSELPKNELFLPIQVGAAKAKVDLGLQRDDDGEDNISAKNSGYCELTAIYWAWKNLDADYYGLFHYRRFYSFADEKFPEDGNDGFHSIYPKVSSPEVFHKFNLDNPDKMRAVIQGADIVTQYKCKVKHLMPMAGPKVPTVYGHYKNHKGIFARTSDIDAAMEEIQHSFPKIAPYFYQYIHGHYFRGYNMFIMRKKYFYGMCDFEFTVLKNLEAKLEPELKARSIDGNRIYGYLAELLTDAYIYYLDQTVPNLKHKNLQRVCIYGDTNPIVPLKPIKSSIPVVINFTQSEEIYSYHLATTINQLIKNNRSKLDIILAHDNNIPDSVLAYIKGLSKGDISIRFINFRKYLDQLETIHNREVMVDFRLVMSHLLTEYKKVIFLDWNTWVKTDLEKLYQTDLDSKTVAAPLDAIEIGSLLYIDRISRVSVVERLQREHNITIDTNNVYNTNVMVVDIPKLEKSVTVDKAIATCEKLRDYPALVAFNLLVPDYKPLSQTYGYHIDTDYSWSYISYKANSFAPINLGQEWKKLTDSYAIGHFDQEGTDHYRAKFATELYTAMRETPMWPLFVLAKADLANTAKISLREKLAPAAIFWRIVNKLLPKGSKHRYAAKKIYHKIIRR